MTLACEDVNPKLVDVGTVADVYAEKLVDKPTKQQSNRSDKRS